MARDGPLYREHHVPRVWSLGVDRSQSYSCLREVPFFREDCSLPMCTGWGVLKEAEEEREREADAPFSGRNLKVVLENHEPSMVTSAWVKLSGVAAHRSR